MPSDMEGDRPGEDAGVPERSRPLLRLKNGAAFEAADVVCYTTMLRGYLEGHPNGRYAVRQLHNLIQGAPIEPHPEVMDFRTLGRQLQLLDGEGNPVLIIRAIAEAAFRDTPDGLMIVDPWVATPENLETLKIGAATYSDWMKRSLKRWQESRDQEDRDKPRWDR